MRISGWRSWRIGLTLGCAALMSASSTVVAQESKSESGVSSFSNSSKTVPTGGDADTQPRDGGFEVRMRNGKPVLVDTLNGYEVISSAGPAVVSTRITETIKPEVQIVPSPDEDGYDMVMTYTNTTPTVRKLASLSVGSMRIGRYVDTKDVRWGGRERVQDGSRNQAEVLVYPGDLYSPLQVLSGEEYTIGISVQYPALVYKHDVGLYPTAPTWLNRSIPDAERRWVLFIHLSRPNPESTFMYYDAYIQPGETRRYTVSVRVTRKKDEWIRTLEPYARYFHRSQGPVAYERDTRPVKAMVFAGGHAQADDNPMGWYAGHRVDLNGWQYTTQTIINDPHERAMVWAPSGLYYHQGFNYPFQFTTHWLSDDDMSNAIDPQVGLPRVSASGKDLGLWWGNSARYADRWEPDEQPILDLNNPAHHEAAHAEIDLAVQAGATTIGMDAMSHKRVPVWEQVRWIDELQQRAPGVKFIIEPKACDVVHRVAGTYFLGYGVADVIRFPADLTNIRNPHYLADLINPGHETWAAMRWDPEVRGGRIATEQDRIRDANRAAFFGFIPLLLEQVDPDDIIPARKSWLATVPSDLWPQYETEPTPTRKKSR